MFRQLEGAILTAALRIVALVLSLGTILFAYATGGKDLKVKLGLNLRLFGSFVFGFRGGAAAEPAAPPAK